ncbi:MAG: AAA family ATPase, partial [Deltaproteobacteria bacterium]|nr:AAA family ATPase [Deltaproteobacteria bacterium]
MRCSNCGNNNPDGLKFCNQCGARFKARCSKCGFDNAPGARFCGECGVALSAGEPAPAPLQPGPDGGTQGRPPSQFGERRHLTVLFCDLVGSTELAARLDPEEYQHMLAAYHRAAAEAIARFEGHVAKYLGDGVMAYFGYPAAHDNDAERAVRAGIAILEAISGQNQQSGTSSRSSSPVELPVRIGIDSGPVVVGMGAGTEIDVFGEAPNIASRVQTAAAPDTVLITAATHRLVTGLFVAEDCGAQSLKGIEQPIQLYRVVRAAGVRGRLAAAAASHGLTPFVGRGDEMRMLTSRWQRVLDGEGQAVLIIGEAGIGKSRLVQQFRQRIADTPHTWVEAAAAPFYQNTPFYPVSEALWQLVWEHRLNRFANYLRELQEKERGHDSAEQTREPVVDDRLDELQSGLISAGLVPSEAIPLIAPLLNLPLTAVNTPSSISPEEQRRRLLATLIEWLLGTARTRPLVVAIEDMHWADPSTLELIQLLLEQAATARMLLVFTARPEFRADWPLRAHHTQITLNRLSAGNVREMVAQVAAQNAFTGETLDAVVERTSGVPLFVEELTRALLETGDGAVVAREIPVTLHDSLMARLDRLGSAKEVLQLGSVIGGDFSYELLHAVHPLNEDELQRELHRLSDADLLHVRGLPPHATYQFKHALIRDAAYEALLKSRRKELHRRVASAIDEKFHDIKEAHPEVLARHWAEAGETEFAITELERAGKAAEARSAFQEALQTFEQALSLLELSGVTDKRENRELELRQSVIRMLWVVKGYAAPETVAATQKAAELAERSGQLLQLVTSMSTKVMTVASPDIDAVTDQLLELARREGSDTALAFAHTFQIVARYVKGDLAGVEEHFSTGRNFFNDPIFRQFPGFTVSVLGASSLNAWMLGNVGAAEERHAEMMAATNWSNPYDGATSGMFSALLRCFMRDYGRAQAIAIRALSLAEKHQYPWLAAMCRCFLGESLTHLGHMQEGVKLLRRGIDELLSLKAERWISNVLARLAALQGDEVSVAAALETVEDALNFHELVYCPEILRIRGELRLKQGEARR